MRAATNRADMLTPSLQKADLQLGDRFNAFYVLSNYPPVLS